MQNIFANTRKGAYYKVTHGFVLSDSFCWGYFAKIERKCSRNRPKIFLKCSRIIFLQVCQILWIYLLESSSFCLTFWAQTWIHEELLLLFGKFLGEFGIFSATLSVFATLWGVCKFLCKIFCKFFATSLIKNFLQFIWYSFYTAILFYNLLMLLWNSFENSWGL